MTTTTMRLWLRWRSSRSLHDGVWGRLFLVGIACVKGVLWVGPDMISAVSFFYVVRTLMTLKSGSHRKHLFGPYVSIMGC